jgi:hypothetical protein
MDFDEIVRICDNMGFLTDLPEDIKTHTALCYQKAAQIMVEEPTSVDFLTTTIYPVIYRITKTGLKIKNVNDLIEKFKQFIIDNRGVFDDIHSVSNIDVEAQICIIFSEDYIEWIKDNPELDPIRYIPKHKLQ